MSRHSFFYEIGKCYVLSYFIKNPSGDRTAAYNENVAGATAAGEEFRMRNSLFFIVKLIFTIPPLLLL